ncbi:hypothetical protein ABQ397_27645 [Serratia fonticola]|uniref:hypothetical protein n=1 Tax=Serratia fonticola TaxID=47917 RepID=UPI003AB05D06|nr:hypothetical protein [Serratia fonticola]
MKRIMIVAALVAITQNSFARPLLADEIIAVENLIREDMKDPEAANFYHQDFPFPEETNIYCGYVNGKNSYGAYTGKILFDVFLVKNTDGEIKALPLGRDVASGGWAPQEVIASTCAGAGYNLPIKKMFLKGVNKSRKERGISPIDSYFITK